jgi:hypothetical protein
MPDHRALWIKSMTRSNLPGFAVTANIGDPDRDPANGALVVGEDSQRNAPGRNGDNWFGLYTRKTYITHFKIDTPLGLENETASQEIGRDVEALLCRPKSEFRGPNRPMN